MSPSDRLRGYRAYQRPAEAFDPVAWRPPATPRFDPRPANDVHEVVSPEPAATEARAGVPAWAVSVLGGLVAALAGAMLGGMLQI